MIFSFIFGFLLMVGMQNSTPDPQAEAVRMIEEHQAFDRSKEELAAKSNQIAMCSARAEAVATGLSAATKVNLGELERHGVTIIPDGKQPAVDEFARGCQLMITTTPVNVDEHYRTGTYPVGGKAPEGKFFVSWVLAPA